MKLFKPLFFTTSLVILLNACSAPAAVRLENREFVQVNYPVKTAKSSKVVINKDFKAKSWYVDYTFSYTKNQPLVPLKSAQKFFYYAHHASNIYINAEPDLAQKYAYYLRQNGVDAQIETNSYVADFPETVNFLIVNQTKGENNEK